MNSDNPNFGSALTPPPNETPQARKPWRTPQIIKATINDGTNILYNTGSDAHHSTNSAS